MGATEWTGVLGFAALLILIGLRVPVGIAMLVVGLVGIGILASPTTAMLSMAGQAFELSTLYSLAVLPLFILMGNLAAVSGLSRDLFDAAQATVGRIRGGLASATIVGSAGFAALSGSSIASAVTMGRIAYPEMKARGYGERLSTASIAAGGTLGILLPPSTGFVLYAILTEESIGRLFIAGILPGLMLTVLFLVAIAAIVALRPAESGPADGPRREGAPVALRVLPILGILLVSIGGIYFGVLTTVEASGAGALLTLLLALARGKLSLGGLGDVTLGALRTTGLCFLILVGAMVFSPFVARSHLPDTLTQALTALDLGPYGTLALILAVYAALGMVIEGLSLMVITLPVTFPIVTGLGFDPIWFGVIMVIVLEMGLISPPVGVNCFVVQSIAPEVPISRIFAGILPFWLAMIAAVILLVLFPQIALLLPNAMF